MDADKKKTALRMIPYGLYVLTAEGADGTVASATVTWVTQASFEPPLLVVAVKRDSTGHRLIEESKAFALNILGKAQNEVAVSFFKSQEREGNTIGGQPFRSGETGAPILENVPAVLECRLVDVVSRGDHSIFVGEIVNAEVRADIEGRPDEASLWLRDLGPRMFYGG